MPKNNAKLCKIIKENHEIVIRWAIISSCGLLPRELHLAPQDMNSKNMQYNEGAPTAGVPRAWAHNGQALPTNIYLHLYTS